MRSFYDTSVGMVVVCQDVTTWKFTGNQNVFTPILNFANKKELRSNEPLVEKIEIISQHGTSFCCISI